MLKPFASIREASFYFGPHCLFENLDLDLFANEWVAILGPSGVGKSSLLRMLAGLHTSEEHYSAQINTTNNIPFQKQIAYMAQNDLLLPWLTTLDNTVLSVILKCHKQLEKENIYAKAQTLLKTVGLESACHLYPHQLSGGMRQRVALVRTLLQDKPIILIDEPFSALDAVTRYKLQNLTATLLQGKIVVFITHDPQEAFRLGNKIYVLQGQPAQLKLIAELKTSLPHDLDDPQFLNLQKKILIELSAAHEVISCLS